ncbi:MAG: NUDIX domain-containing protein [Ilumatobacter sp.]|nr:NUDIX domain-containing protein [Ilumatobacter sp.]
MPSPHFRAGVVAVVRRADGDVLAFERADVPGAWQLPQGGIELGETAHDAVWRELGEETGLGPDDVRLIGEHDGWTVYQWPSGVRSKKGRLGQAQRWFFFEPVRDTVEPTPDGKEFSDWRWIDPASLVDQVVDFRRGPYEEVLGG